MKPNGPIDMKITTNHHWHFPVYGHELTYKERDEFDYLDDEEVAIRDFLRYKGEVYDLGDLMLIPEASKSPPGPIKTLREQGWEAYADGSAFHCTVFAFDHTGPYVQVKVGVASW